MIASQRIPDPCGFIARTVGLAAGMDGFSGVEPSPTVLAMKPQGSGIRWEAIMAGEHRPAIVTIAPSGWDRGNTIVDAA
jgi:hypothetical protein